MQHYLPRLFFSNLQFYIICPNEANGFSSNRYDLKLGQLNSATFIAMLKDAVTLNPGEELSATLEAAATSTTGPSHRP
jgi:hypothetical protein